VDWILAHAKVRDTESTFKELMNFEGEFQRRIP